jgi:hypothetical protein
MKRKLFILLLMATILGVASASWAGSVLLEDKFPSLDPGWGAADQFFDIKDGKMIVQPAKNETYTAVYEGNIFPNELDTSITMKFAKADDPTYGSGLIFWSKGLKDYYALMINANGWFTVQRRMGDRFINPVTWRENGAINKGAGVNNRLRVVTKGNKATIFINDKEIISLMGQPPEGGSQIGVRTASGPEKPNVAEFTDLKVTTP